MSTQEGEILANKMLEKELQKYFGFSTFKTGQREVISKLVDNQSAVAIFPTGAGKSLCYQLPAMLLPHLTLVVSPLLALMKDQIDFLAEHNIPAARLDSTLSKEEYDRILTRARNGELKILMIAVERFNNERFRAQLKRMKISLLVVDEAHCISEWGHNFRPDYLKLPIYRKEFAIPQVLLLTATATEQVRNDMSDKFQVPKENVTVTGFYRSNLFLQVSPTAEAEKLERLHQRISEAPHAPSIVYVTLQKTAEQISNSLCDKGINSSHYHAGMADEEREQIQNEFLAGKINCIVATIAFGMGIDKKDIRRVIHYDLPKSIENYSQEIGRSGRDDAQSFCEVLANRDNVSQLENFIYGDTPDEAAIIKLLYKIKQHTKPQWETKLVALSYELDIRLLPLKTLLVYLEVEGILRPKHTRFDEYTFKYQLEPAAIVNKFSGERRDFIRAVFENSNTKKVWTYVDMPAILQSYQQAERDRVVAALEYFSEQGWIELRAKQGIEVYEILNNSFDVQKVAKKMTRLFEAKEKQEIQRIHNLIDFFANDSCISKRLALYFGEDIGNESCGHCSVCQTGTAAVEHTSHLPPLSTYSLRDLAEEFSEIAGDYFTKLNITKFLCGITSPGLIRLKAKRMDHFGILEKYPFMDVKSWVEEEQEEFQKTNRYLQ